MSRHLQSWADKSVINVKDYGAKGNYVPSTGVGTDDTTAIAAAITALTAVSSNKKALYIPYGVYKVTATLTIPSGVMVFGDGFHSSVIWGALTNVATDLLQLGTPGSSVYSVSLKDFSIVGYTAPGRYAINATGIALSDIDVYVNGAWTYMLHAGDGGLPGSGHGIENSKIALHNANADPSFNFLSTYLSNANGGMYCNSWINASEIYLDIGLIASSGNGFTSIGTYAAGNNFKLSGILQGVSGWAVNISGTGGKFELQNLHCEGNTNDISITGHSHINICNSVLGNVSLASCTYAKVRSKGSIKLFYLDSRNRSEGSRRCR
jgi:hypothetical protein